MNVLKSILCKIGRNFEFHPYYKLRNIKSLLVDLLKNFPNEGNILYKSQYSYRSVPSGPVVLVLHDPILKNTHFYPFRTCLTTVTHNSILGLPRTIGTNFIFNLSVTLLWFHGHVPLPTWVLSFDLPTFKLFDELTYCLQYGPFKEGVIQSSLLKLIVYFVFYSYNCLICPRVQSFELYKNFTKIYKNF